MLFNLMSKKKKKKKLSFKSLLLVLISILEQEGEPPMWKEGE